VELDSALDTGTARRRKDKSGISTKREAIMATPSQQQPYVHIPDTVSLQAQAFLRTLQDPALKPAFPKPDDLAGWEKMRAFAEADGKAHSAPLLQRYEHTVTEGRLGGVPVVNAARSWIDEHKSD